MLASMTITMKELYPHATDSEREEAQQRLEAYLRLILRMHDRVELEPVDERENRA